MSSRPPFWVALLLGGLGAWPVAAHPPAPPKLATPSVQALPIVKPPPGLFVRLPRAPRILLWDEVRPLARPEQVRFDPPSGPARGLAAWDGRPKRRSP